MFNAFNNGENPKCLPEIELDGQLLNYKQNTKFLGVYITTKLNWRLHIENVINKAIKQSNFLKNSTQSWCQDTKTLLHLYISLVRSKLIYGQEVYFLAPNTLLKKLQSIDSKAIKLAIGVPVHTNTSKIMLHRSRNDSQNNVNWRFQSTSSEVLQSLIG